MSRSAKPTKPQEPPNSLVSAHWSGPLPPPATLKQFDDVVQGGAERIFRMAEAEQAHRHSIERAMLASDSRAISRGQWLGALVSLASIGGAIGTALTGVYWAVPVALVSVPIASIVRALIGREKS